MTDQKKPATPRRLNSDGLMKAVGIAMFHAGKLDKDQRGDLITAALQAFKTSLIDDLTHAIGVGTVSDEDVCARIVDLGLAMEDMRHTDISRFANLCELLKSECDIHIEFLNAPPKVDGDVVMMPNNGSVN